MILFSYSCNEPGCCIDYGICKFIMCFIHSSIAFAIYFPFRVLSMATIIYFLVSIISTIDISSERHHTETNIELPSPQRSLLQTLTQTRKNSQVNKQNHQTNPHKQPEKLTQTTRKTHTNIKKAYKNIGKA